MENEEEEGDGDRNRGRGRQKDRATSIIISKQRQNYGLPLLSSGALLQPSIIIKGHRENIVMGRSSHSKKNLLFRGGGRGIAMSSLKLAAVLVTRVFFTNAWPFLQAATLSSFFIRKQVSMVSFSHIHICIHNVIKWIFVYHLQRD